MADIIDQPPPIATARRPAWELVIEHAERTFKHVVPDAENQKTHDLVIADMRERDRVGRERYGVPLTANNGRKHLVDAYQEAQDKAVYLRAFLDENGIDPYLNEGDELGQFRAVVMIFNANVRDLYTLRDLIELGL